MFRMSFNHLFGGLINPKHFVVVDIKVHIFHRSIDDHFVIISVSIHTKNVVLHGDKHSH